MSKQDFAITPVVLDTCVLLVATRGMFQEVRERQPRGANGTHFLVPRTVVDELAKKGVRLLERAIELGFAGSYEIFEDRDTRIVQLAANLPIHYPDNLIVASAIVSGAFLLTFDDTMKITALCCGVPVVGFSSRREGPHIWRLGDFTSAPAWRART
jgi:rRNA-processing protein FCF1